MDWVLHSEIVFKPAGAASNQSNNTKDHHHQTTSAPYTNGTSNGTNRQTDNSLGLSTTNNKSNGHQNGISNGVYTAKNAKNNANHNNSSDSNALNCNGHINEEFQTPKHQLCDPNIVKLDWLQSEKVGGGLVNVGNTCFLNSVLQCLTYCPPLYNFLVKSNGGHSSSCKINQFCMLCEMEKHVKRIRSSTGASIKPISIVQRLKYINKSFQFGRQEDAHEFLRYLLDHMWKACLQNLDMGNKLGKIDPRIKETTVINHIFGGYHRSQVLCLTCNSRSNTFDFFMDFILDIRNAKSLEEALKRFTQPETLENENAYKCSKCRKKVTARKKFTVYKAPNVATFQLKRFDSDRIFGGKVTKFISYPDELDLRPYMSDPTKSSIKYHLSAVLVHVGHSSNSGHYFCFIKNSNNFWYRMDDSNVSLVGQSTVLQQQAYVLFYTRKSSDLKHPSNGISQELGNSFKSNTANTNTTNLTSNNVNNHYNNKNNKFAATTTTTTSNNNTSTSTSSITTTNNGPVRLFKQTNGNHKITSYFTPNKMITTSTSSSPLTATASTISTSASTSVSASPSTLTSPTTPASSTTATSSENGKMNLTSAFITWNGSKSKFDETYDLSKRKLNETTDRDRFNEELDQGKVKKIKSQLREDRFSNLSKTNPFQRFTSNGYQQYNNNNNNNSNKKRDSFQKHNRRHPHKNNKFHHNGKHRGRFNRRK